MDQEKEMNAKILAIICIIQNNHPELSKYISEIPQKELSNEIKEVTIKNLKDYYDSLKNILVKYTLDKPIL